MDQHQEAAKPVPSCTAHPAVVPAVFARPRPRAAAGGQKPGGRRAAATTSRAAVFLDRVHAPPRRRSAENINVAADAGAARRKPEQVQDPTFEILKVALRNQYRARAMPRPLLGTGADARYWLCLDVCGLCCAILSQVVILFSVSSILHDLYRHGTGITGLLNAIVCLTLGGMASLSHLKAMLSDPGAVPRAAAPLARDEERARLAASAASGYRSRAKGWCHRCASYKPPRAHHDSVTNRCIVKMDHYCPWTNNAIGVLNHKFFILFIGYTFALCIHSMVVIVQLTYAAPKLPKMNRQSAEAGSGMMTTRRSS